MHRFPLRSTRSALAALAPLAAAVALAPPAAASPVTNVRFDAVIEGTYSYAIADDYVGIGNRQSKSVTAEGTFSSAPATIDVTYGGGAPPIVRSTSFDVTASTGGVAHSRTESDAGGVFEQSCVYDPSPFAASGFLGAQDLDSVEEGAAVPMYVKAFDYVTVLAKQSGSCKSGAMLTLGSEKVQPRGRFDFRFDMPWEALDSGKTIQLLRHQNEGCPGADLPYVTKCTFTWQGKLTLTQSSRTVIDGGTGETSLEPAPLDPTSPSTTTTPAVPATPTTPAGSTTPASTPATTPAATPTQPAPSPVPGPAPTQAASDAAKAGSVREAVEAYLRESQGAGSDQAKVDAVSRAVREHLSGSGASAQATCPTTCSGTLTATAVATARATGRGVRLGSAPLRPVGRPRAATRPAGPQQMAATLRFSPKARRALRRHRYVALRTTMRVAGIARPVTVTKVLRRR